MVYFIGDGQPAHPLPGPAQQGRWFRLGPYGRLVTQDQAVAAFLGGAAMPGFENQTQSLPRFQPLLGNCVAVAADQNAIEVTFLPEAAEPQQRTDGLARPRPGMHQDIFI